MTISLKYLNLFVGVVGPIAATLVEKLLQSNQFYSLVIEFDPKTIVYSFSDCFFKNNVKLNTYPIDNNKFVYSEKPD